MIESRYGLTITADIHGMQRADAKKQLELLLSRVPKDITEVVVIHGCNRGTALQSMVRKELSHPRIIAKHLSLNNGETILVLRRL